MSQTTSRLTSKYPWATRLRIPLMPRQGISGLPAMNSLCSSMILAAASPIPLLAPVTSATVAGFACRQGNPPCSSHRQSGARRSRPSASDRDNRQAGSSSYRLSIGENGFPQPWRQIAGGQQVYGNAKQVLKLHLKGAKIEQGKTLGFAERNRPAASRTATRCCASATDGFKGGFSTTTRLSHVFEHGARNRENQTPAP